jgi:hypothetical protein
VSEWCDRFSPIDGCTGAPDRLRPLLRWGVVFRVEAVAADPAPASLGVVDFEARLVALFFRPLLEPLRAMESEREPNAPVVELR